jgi:pimeloyl-ACP methyl ester carboxylesterase
MVPTTQITRDGLAFNITEDGPADGEPVLLLHGFPQHSDSWDALVPLLTEAGYRTIRMDQRGYSPGARPRNRSAYRITELVNDAAEVIDHYGGRVHVVGHDWGAVVAWGLGSTYPDRVASLTALSVPHPGAFLRAMLTSTQGLKSWYMYFFQLPWLPEAALRRQLVPLLLRSGQSRERARRDAEGFREPGALTGALNWYRAMPLLDPRRVGDPVRSPTLFIYSDGDIAIGRKGVERCARYVEGPYQLETLSGVSHWIPDEAPAETAALLIPHLKRWPVTTDAAQAG